MVIQRTESQILITLPVSVNLDGLQRLINYLLYKEAVKDSKATQPQVDELARYANKPWWEEKKLFLPD